MYVSFTMQPMYASMYVFFAIMYLPLVRDAGRGALLVASDMGAFSSRCLCAALISSIIKHCKRHALPLRSLLAIYTILAPVSVPRSMHTTECTFHGLYWHGGFQGEKGTCGNMRTMAILDKQGTFSKYRNLPF